MADDEQELLPGTPMLLARIPWKEVSMDGYLTCDDIEWLVDLLGTMSLLQCIISSPGHEFPVVDVSDRGPVRSAFRGGRGDDGLYFDGAHWYSIRGGVKTDSYTEGYQIKGTAHFCQTFAAMIFIGVDRAELTKGNYAENIRAAMRFWMGMFKAHKGIRDFFLDEIHTSSHAKKDPFLATMTHKQLMTFMQQVADHAATFINCQEG